MALEFIHIRLQPDRFSEIKFIAHFLERMKDFVRPCLIGLIRDRRVPQQVVVIILNQILIFRSFSSACWSHT